MSIRLLIDQGNTRTKVAVVSATDSGAARRLCRLTIVNGLQVSDLEALCNNHHVDSAILCSVSGTDPVLLQWLREHFGERFILLGPDTPTPLSIGYASPHTLGMDRLAAAVGARSMPDMAGRDILVADIGTAVTYDRVTADGSFLGGNIAPGILMRLRALHTFTARLPLVEVDGPTPIWGTDTTTALRAGAVEGVAAEVEHYRTLLSPGAATVISGGDAPLVTDRLRVPHVVVTDLIMRGLDRILSHNNL